MVAGGYLDDAKVNAEKNVSRFKYWTDKGYDIITACTSCGLMLKQEYNELFDIEALETCSKRIYDAMEYLAILADNNELNTDFKFDNKNICIMLLVI